MLLPNKDGHFEDKGMKCIDYHAMVDRFHRVLECYTTEDGVQWANLEYWTDMNDFEKFICKKRGWNLSKYYPDEKPRYHQFVSFMVSRFRAFKRNSLKPELM